MITDGIGLYSVLLPSTITEDCGTFLRQCYRKTLPSKQSGNIVKHMVSENEKATAVTADSMQADKWTIFMCNNMLLT